MYILETDHLSHQFSSGEKAVSDLNLRVPAGSIYGFLGANGAGKTTSLRLVLGLLKKQSGGVTIFGKPFDQNRVAVLSKLGSLIESPSVYSHLTAVENLKLFQKIYRCPTSRIGDVLAMVGLTGTGNKPASRFSLGMKQRLGIAIAMLHSPDFLILDEPTNGLDPNGIIEIREMLRTLNREQGLSILISSHLLSEIEKLVTHAGIIHQGKLMFQGTFEELMNKRIQTARVVVETSDMLKAMETLTAGAWKPTPAGEEIIVPFSSRSDIAKINQQLVAADIEVYAIRNISRDLETVFMDLIKTPQHGAAHQ
jgi:ABC-type multidrug transport system ATPase subunit